MAGSKDRFCAVLLTLALILSCVPQALAAGSATATTMRLMKTEGTVELTDSSGRSLTVREKLRLHNGYRVETEEASYAWINLDDTKLIKEDAVSDVEVRESGDKLELLLNEGSLFFNVTEPLEDGETLNIRTSTIMTGIRGTCGWVKVIDQWTSQVYILEGTVQLAVTDPVTGQTKSEPVSAGESAVCRVYPQDQIGDKCDIIRDTYSEAEIDGFVLTEIAPDDGLCGRIYDGSGLDLRDYPGDPQVRLRRDQASVHEELEAIEDQVGRQDNKISTEPVWSDPVPDPAPARPASFPSSSSDDGDDGDDGYGGSGGGNTGGGPVAPPSRPTHTITFNENFSGGGVSTVTVVEGGSLTLPTPTRTGYTFDGWFTAADGGEQITTGTVFTEDATVYAHWTAEGPGGEPGAITVTFNANGGSVTPAGAATGADGTLSSLPTPTRTGYTFDGWFTAATGGTEVTVNTEFTANATVYAHWTLVTYTVTFNANGGSTTPDPMTTAEGGKLASLPAGPDRADYTFDGWFTAAAGGEQITTGTVFTKDTTIYAHWSIVQTGWRYDEAAKTLYITGPMTNYTGAGLAPWKDLPFTKAVIESGVTGIGTYAFAGCTGLTGVTIPASVNKIGDYAFEGCPALVDVTITDGVKAIGAFAFNGCTSLTAVNIPSSVQTIDWQAFAGCSGLTSIVIPEILHIASNTFDHCTNLTSVTIPASVSSIGDSAFYDTGLTDVYYYGTTANWKAIVIDANNDPLTSATIHYANQTAGTNVYWEISDDPKVLRIWGSGAMNGYYSNGSSSDAPWATDAAAIETLVIADGITGIGSCAFKGFTALTDVTIPGSVTSIGNDAFQDCSSLKSVIIREGVTSISGWMFKNCTGLTSVTIPGSVTSIGSNAFEACTSLASVTIPDSVTSIGSNAFYKCTALTNVTIPGNVSSVGISAFQDCISLTGVTIHNGVASIGNSAFNGCTSLTSVTIPGSVTTIGEFAFQNCSSLTDAAIPVSATSIGKFAFKGCSSLPSVTIPSGVSSIAENAFKECTALATVTIQEGVTSIGGSAFAGCTSLTSLTIPSSVNSIGANAFLDCTSLTGVTIPEGVTSIDNGAFHGCSSLKSVTIPGSVTSIGDWAFGGCGSLENAAIPDKVTSISSHLFDHCSSLKSVTLPNSVTSIGSHAFDGCSGLTSVTIPKDVASIDSWAFSYCTSLTSMTIPAKVTSISGNLFYGCSGLTSVTILGNVSSIGDSAFAGCTSLANVYYGGTQEQWVTITIGTKNDPLTSAAKHYSSAGSGASLTGPDTRASGPAGSVYMDARLGALFLTARASSPAGSVYPDAPAGSGYTDVPAGAWYADAVAWCRERGLMAGTGGNTFSPDAPMTRAMMVTVLHNLAGKPPAAAAAAFPDVKAGQWYTEAVSWAREKKIVVGYPNGNFGTDDPVTHEQVQLLLRHYSGDPDLQTIGADTPKSPATRAEIAATLMDLDSKQTLASGTLAVFSAMDVMCSPSGIALDSDGSLLVADVYHKQIWRVAHRASESYAGGATVQDLYGRPVGGYNDDGLDSSFFKEPWAIAPFLGGWAVTDTANNAVRLIRPDGVQTLNGVTSEKLKVTDLGVAFDHPTGLASDSNGDLYVSDTFNGAVRRITPEGGVSTVAKDLDEPTGLCWKDGVLYIAETGANRIVKLQDGKLSRVAGDGKAALTDGRAESASFDAPQGVAVGSDGSIYVADTGNGAIRKIGNGAVTTLAAHDPEQLDGGLTSPTGLLVQDDKLYICDTFARKVFVYQLGEGK